MKRIVYRSPSTRFAQLDVSPGFSAAPKVATPTVSPTPVRQPSLGKGSQLLEYRFRFWVPIFGLTGSSQRDEKRLG